MATRMWGPFFTMHGPAPPTPPPQNKPTPKNQNPPPPPPKQPPPPPPPTKPKTTNRPKTSPFSPSLQSWLPDKQGRCLWFPPHYSSRPAQSQSPIDDQLQCPTDILRPSAIFYQFIVLPPPLPVPFALGIPFCTNRGSEMTMFNASGRSLPVYTCYVPTCLSTHPAPSPWPNTFFRQSYR